MPKPPKQIEIAPIALHPEYAVAMHDFEQVRATHRATELKIAALKARISGKAPPSPVEGDGKTSAIARIAAHFGGHKLDTAIDAQAELHEAEALLAELGKAWGEASRNLDAVKEALSYEISKACDARHRAILQRIIDSAVALTVALDDERALSRELNAAGYWPRSDILGGPPLPGAVSLGSLSIFGSQISRYIRDIAQLKGLRPSAVVFKEAAE